MTRAIGTSSAAIAAIVDKSKFTRRHSRTPRRFCLIVVAVAAASSPAWADFTGRVVNVHDGDTLTVLVERTQVLADIDAPELKQAFGKRSRQSLADMCAGKAADVAERGKD